MNGRHVAAQGRVGLFVKTWKKAFPNRDKVTNGFGIYDLTVVDLETLMQPRQVVRTLPQLQALPVGTIIVVQSGRAAQIEEDLEAYADEDGVIDVKNAKRLIYVGTDLHDALTPAEHISPAERDTLRRMLPATVIDTKDT